LNAEEDHPPKFKQMNGIKAKADSSSIQGYNSDDDIIDIAEKKIKKEKLEKRGRRENFDNELEWHPNAVGRRLTNYEASEA
jgi:hypothetical protein